MIPYNCLSNIYRCRDAIKGDIYKGFVVAKLFSGYHNKWHYESTGVVFLHESDNLVGETRKHYYFSLVDMQSFGIVWKQELYTGLKLNMYRNHFIYFEGDTCFYGLSISRSYNGRSFFNLTVRTIFPSQLYGGDHFSRRDKKRKRISRFFMRFLQAKKHRVQINGPPRIVGGHYSRPRGFYPGDGNEYENLDEDWKSMVDEAGFSKDGLGELRVWKRIFKSCDRLKDELGFKKRERKKRKRKKKKEKVKEKNATVRSRLPPLPTTERRTLPPPPRPPLLPPNNDVFSGMKSSRTKDDLLPVDSSNTTDDGIIKNATDDQLEENKKTKYYDEFRTSKLSERDRFRFIQNLRTIAEGIHISSDEEEEEDEEEIRISNDSDSDWDEEEEEW